MTMSCGKRRKEHPHEIQHQTLPKKTRQQCPFIDREKEQQKKTETRRVVMYKVGNYGDIPTENLWGTAGDYGDCEDKDFCLTSTLRE